MFHLLVTTLSYPADTAKNLFNYFKSFPSIFKLTQPLIPVP